MKLVQLEKFSDEAIEGLSETFGDDKDIIISEVDNGISQLYQVNGDSWLVTRLDIFGEVPELVIVCYQGKDVLKLGEYLAEVARKKGIHSLRCHTRSKKFARAIERRSGAELLEYVYRWKL